MFRRQALRGAAKFGDIVVVKRVGGDGDPGVGCLRASADLLILLVLFVS
jgi:hypothetical protein